MRCRALVAVGLFASACASERSFDLKDGRPTSTAKPIYGGTADDGDPEVFGLGVAHAGIFCSATRIGARTLLSAAHCADPNGLGMDISQGGVALNASDGSFANAIKIVKYQLHPDWDP